MMNLVTTRPRLFAACWDSSKIFLNLLQQNVSSASAMQGDSVRDIFNVMVLVLV